MKILAFVDTHGNKTALNKIVEKSKQADILVCAGDISNWGEHLEELISILKKANKELLIIPGNHETAEQIKNLHKKFKFVIPIHKGSYKLKNYLFFGYGGGGFSREEPELKKIIPKFKKTIKDSKVILVSHAPPYGTELDFLPDENHAGCKTITDFIKEIKPRLAIAGHLHEDAGIKDKVGKTLIINPGPNGKLIKI